MRAVVGVTDDRWATYLQDRPHITEANFWLPTATTTFRALTEGEPFLFKTHHPANRLVGGGFFSGYARLTVSEAWSLFGEGNGVGSVPDLLASIRRYRTGDGEPDPLIGCVLLRDLFFVAGADALPGPVDFAKNIVRFKGYDLDRPNSPLESALFELLLRSGVAPPFDPGDDTLMIDGPTRGLARLALPRVGQQAFKGLVLTSYQRRCAITGSRIRPALEAAHIRPIADAGLHRVDNGLLLRSDVHTLFDRGYLGIDDRYRLQVSSRLRTDFGNGAEFYARSGTAIAVPERRADRPNADAVRWHMDTTFLA